VHTDDFIEQVAWEDFLAAQRDQAFDDEGDGILLRG
jgi:hypothetical protein